VIDRQRLTVRKAPKSDNKWVPRVGAGSEGWDSWRVETRAHPRSQPSPPDRQLRESEIGFVIDIQGVQSRAPAEGRRASGTPHASVRYGARSALTTAFAYLLAIKRWSDSKAGSKADPTSSRGIVISRKSLARNRRWARHCRLSVCASTTGRGETLFRL
jgi:hypothetical protein